MSSKKWILFWIENIYPIRSISCLEDDKTYVEMLDNFFAKKFLYFSHEYDLTCTLQHSCDNSFEKYTFIEVLS